MTNRWLWILLAALPLTARPLTYIIDYGGGIGDPAYADLFRDYPPDLLHLGVNAAPLPSYWFQKGAEPDPSPEKVVAETERLRGQVAALHAAGIEQVIPYLCAITIGGDAEQRLGWFAFYDRWAEYDNLLGLGPKPATDPTDWLQRQPDGSPKFFYNFNHPPYAPLHRYAIAPSHPAWQQFLAGVARQMGRAGYDGTFVDNPTHLDFSPAGQQAFAAWVAAELPADVVRDVWPDGKVALEPDRKTPAGAITHQWFGVQMAALLQIVETSGSEGLGRPFLVNPNAAGWPESAARRGWDLRCMNSAIGLAMDEGAGWPGLVSEDYGGRLRRQVVRDNLFSYLRGTMPGRDPVDALATVGELVSDDQLLLASAGAAAFGGVWVHRRIGDPRVDGWERFNAFARDHRALYDDALQPVAKVGVAFDWPTMLAGWDNHPKQVSEVVHRLLRDQIPVGLFEPLESSPTDLARYDVVILPLCYCLADESLAALRSYLQNGGRVITLGENGAFDRWRRPREANPFDTFPRYGVHRLDWPSNDAGWDQVRAILGEALPAGGSLVAEDEVPGLRLAWWRDGDREIVHVLNYRVPAVAGEPVVPLPEFTLRLPGRAIRSATLHRPDAEPVTLTPVDGALRVPPVTVAGALELTCGDAPEAEPVAVARWKPDVPLFTVTPGTELATAQPWAGMPELPGGPTRWRFAQTAMVRAEGTRLAIDVRFVSTGYGGSCRALVLGPDGKPVLDASFEDERRTLVIEPAEPGGIYLLLVDPGRNAVEFEADAPLTVIAAGGVADVMSQVRPLYFQVPAGVTRFELTATANSPNETAKVTVYRPDGAAAGELIGELDTPETLMIDVPAGAAPGIWRLEVGRAPTGGLDDVKLRFDPQIPPQLADHPTRLLLPAP